MTTLHWWWYCDRCGHHTDRKPERSWVEAERDWHISQQHPRDRWRPYELAVCFWDFP